MSEVVIKVENLGKQYRLGSISTRTLSLDLERWFYRMMGKPDPFLKIGETNDRTQKANSEFVWALKDINFEIKQGQIVGIIGRNGAGKSTLLKILSRTTTPTIGNIKVKGRVASLLEVGTGFHPELSGKENIFLNGAILGMTKAEIKRKFDEIVDFAGVARYIDTPVKRYSSGMYVRLAFAVAAHLEPEILIVDEVLAVGDAEFQKKCLGKMKDVSANEGRTVLFVSHDMRAIKQITQQAILLANGQIHSIGMTEDVCNTYLSLAHSGRKSNVYKITDKEIVRLGHILRELKFLEVELITDSSSSEIEQGKGFSIRCHIKSDDDKLYKNLAIGVRVMKIDDTPVGVTFSEPIITFKPLEEKQIIVHFKEPLLAIGSYYLTVWIGEGDENNYGKDLDSVDKVCFFNIVPSSDPNRLTTSVWYPDWGSIRFNNLLIAN